MTNDPILPLISLGVEKYGSLAAFAREIGFSRPALSRRRSGTYADDNSRIDAAIRAATGRLICPHLEREITPAACEAHRTKPMPRSNPDALRHWSACRTCPNGGADE